MVDPTSLFVQLKRAFVIARKDIRIYYSKGPVVIIGLLLPVFLFLSFSIGRNLSLETLMPGLIGMTVFFTAASMSPIITPFESQGRTLERLMVAPVSFTTIVFGDILSSFLFGLGISLLPVIIGIALGIRIGYPLIFGIALVVGALCFAALGNMFSVPPTSLPATSNMLSSSVKFPLTFISGIFIPLEEMPAWGRIISYISPLTYFTDIARHSIQGEGFIPLPVDLAMLFVFAAAFLILTMKLNEKTMPRRI